MNFHFSPVAKKSAVSHKVSLLIADEAPIPKPNHQLAVVCRPSAGA